MHASWGGNGLGRKAIEEVEKRGARRRGVQDEAGERVAGARWEESGLDGAGYAKSREGFEHGSILI